MPSLIVHYQELALKGRNRPWFINRLMANVRDVLADLGVERVQSLMGRIEVTLPEGVDREEVIARVGRLFGIANFAFATPAPLDVERVATDILPHLEGRSPRSFRVKSRRADKAFPMTSPEVDRLIGGRIKQAKGWTVDLSDPQLIVHVEIVPGAIFYFLDKRQGPGGLPSGVSGKVACLISGGIDSPVAAYRMMRRGCRVRLVHFHSYPLVSRASIEKVERLAALLARHQLSTRLFLVPFGDVQKRIILGASESLRVVLYRRFMMRIAGRLASRSGAKALVTGEVVGQVASQTLDNLVTIDDAAPLPVLRPLIGMDKEEITAEAIRIGTYPISILPDEDCCQLFTPKRPATAVAPVQAEAAEQALPVDELVDLAVEAATMQDFRFPPASVGSPG
ncbi:MAG: tRNA uracil 4-sulfurtransferase ThiI [Vicinamibacterales bacterium]